MRIVNLMENTPGAAGCVNEHGLSFYVETRKHVLLIDAGPDGELLLANARAKGVDLAKVDTVFLSHGHYDHGDGLAAFASVNPDAVIYMMRDADLAFYKMDNETESHYLGLSDEVKAIPQIARLDGDEVLDEELTVFSGMKHIHPMPVGNAPLRIKEGEELVTDAFSHELCVAIEEDGVSVLMSGCAHSGILNILDRYQEACGGEPDYVISGFHMRKKDGLTDEDITAVLETAEALKKYKKTRFITCHCTGIGAYEIMKQVMGEQLSYIHCGEELEIVPEKDRRAEIARDAVIAGAALLSAAAFVIGRRRRF